MKAIRIIGYKAEPVLEDITKPVPTSGQVLIRVRAAGLNPLDVKLQRGDMDQFFPLTFPYTLGTDLAGDIEQLGPDVEGWALGDQVMARTDPTAGGGLCRIRLGTGGAPCEGAWYSTAQGSGRYSDSRRNGLAGLVRDRRAC